MTDAVRPPDHPDLNIDILGPLRVRNEQAEVEITGQRAVLLVRLALHVGRALPHSDLAQALPGSGDVQQRTRSLLRELAAELPDTALVHDAASARLAVDPRAVDAQRYVTLAAQARHSLVEGAHDQVAADVAAALALWRGSPCPELAHHLPAQAEIERLESTRIGLLEMQQEVAMHDGVDFTTIADLRALVAAHPGRLGLRLLLARALHLMDRQADALAVLRRTATELGGHPASQRLTDLIAVRDPRISSMSVLTDADGLPL